MISYQWLEVDGPAGLERLAKFVTGEFLGSAIIWLRKILSSKARRVPIEQPYIDEDYRRTYYAFYAKKARPFRPNCARANVAAKAATRDLAYTGVTRAKEKVVPHAAEDVVAAAVKAHAERQSDLRERIREAA